MDKQTKYTVITGNVLDGIYLEGIFNDHESAVEFAEYNYHDWTIAEIAPVDFAN